MYETGLKDKVIDVLRRSEEVDSEVGRVGGQYQLAYQMYAWVTFNKGVKSMRQGALEAYDDVMVRMDYCDIDRDCRVVIDGKTYQIMSLNKDYRRNETQALVKELQVD